MPRQRRLTKALLILLFAPFSGWANHSSAPSVGLSTVNAEAAQPQTAGGARNESAPLIKRLGLSGRLDPAVFEQALARYRATPGIRTPVLTIIDYSKPSSEKRFFVIDMEREVLLYDTFVTHGRQSGALYAKAFSNQVSSHQTSLGTFITGETYHGSNGYSLRLDGLDPGINDNARRRYIVIHGADYADPGLVAQQGMLGRSLGCPALPPHLAKAVIDTIKEGSVIFAHGNA